MPFVNQPPGGFTRQTDTPAQVNSTATFGELFDTAASDITSVGMLNHSLSFTQLADGKTDPAFDPFTAENIKGYEQNAGSFINARNADDMALMKRKIDTENTHNQLLSESGLRGVAATLSAGILDPL